MGKELDVTIVELDSRAPLHTAEIRSDTDLSGVDLRRADLRGMDLHGVCLKGACLYRADLQNANLQDADLRDADLFLANLQNADLRGAILPGDRLRTVNLTGARIDGRTQGLDASDAGRLSLVVDTVWEWSDSSAPPPTSTPATRAIVERPETETVPEVPADELLPVLIQGCARKDRKRMAFVAAQWCGCLTSALGVTATAAQLWSPTEVTLLGVLGGYYLLIAACAFLALPTLRRRWYADSGLPST